jgi:hypothetical protein
MYEMSENIKNIFIEEQIANVASCVVEDVLWWCMAMFILLLLRLLRLGL